MSGGSVRAPASAAAFGHSCNVSRETLARCQIYVDFLVRWQAKINLIGPATTDTIWRRHMWDSAQLRPHIPSNSTVLVDLGSGAGFPGFVLALLGLPQVTLIDSDSRKCAFLREAARLTETNVCIINARIENLTGPCADVVTARACAPLPKLLGHIERFLRRDGVALVHKGARVAEELTAARKHWTMSVEQIRSLSDPRGKLLKIKGLSRVA